MTYAQLKKDIVAGRAEIKQGQADFDQARKANVKIKPPTLSRKDLMSYTRTQKQQMKGEAGLSERQRQSNIKINKRAEKIFKKEATAMESGYKMDELTMKREIAENARIDKENSEWKVAERLINKGGRTLALERRYGAPGIVSKLKLMLGDQKKMDAHMKRLEAKQPKRLYSYNTPTTKRAGLKYTYSTPNKKPYKPKVKTPKLETKKTKREYSTYKTPNIKKPTTKFKLPTKTIRKVIKTAKVITQPIVKTTQAYNKLFTPITKSTDLLFEKTTRKFKIKW